MALKDCRKALGGRSTPFSQRVFMSSFRKVFRNALFIVALVLGLAANVIIAESNPNILVIMTDDQGYGDLSVHGNPVLKTPELDRLHHESIRFTNFHVAPMCTPTRGQLLTGVDALRNGAMNVSSGRAMLRTEFPTLASILLEAGYRTAMFGKWHLGDCYPYRPQDRGFEESIWLKSSMSPSAADYWANDYFDDIYVHNGRNEPFVGYCTDVFFEEAISWMTERAKENEPFFCYLATNAPHGPFFVPERYRKIYREQTDQVASFFGMIGNIDENIGGLLAFLQENGIAENTILVFLTDNGTVAGGDVFNAGMRGHKKSLYEGGHRVPFFLRWPGGDLITPQDLDVLAECQDIVPTLIDLCGIDKMQNLPKFDGISLAPLLRGEVTELPDRKLVIQYSEIGNPEPREGSAVVLWKDWRLVKNNELYNVADDLGQSRNVLKEFPEVVKEMRLHYANWWSEVFPRVNEFSRIHIGSTKETLTTLTPCDWKDVFLDRQGQIREGLNEGGAWALYVEKDGIYEISLRRWPYEADAAISSGVPEYHGVDGTYREGVAIPISAVRLSLGDIHLSAPVYSGQKVARFRVQLKEGPIELQAWFQNEEARDLCGAYYAYVRRISR